jgi:rSAM/selenodomain-associated transferase 1
VSGPTAARDTRVIQVFARAPVAGEVKTRLIPALGARGAARLHARMVEHTLAVASQAACELPARLQLWTAGEDPEGWLAAQARRASASLRRQPPGDLGARMRAATGQALATGAWPVLVGSDCPARAAGDWQLAFAALHAGHDVVLQPAQDGGYTLIGLAREAPTLFEDIAWGGPDVFARTCARARSLSLRVACLPASWDVDRPADLARLAALGPWWTTALRGASPGA